MAEIILLERGAMFISPRGENLQGKSPFPGQKRCARCDVTPPMATGTVPPASRPRQRRVCTDAHTQTFLNQVVFSALTFHIFPLQTLQRGRFVQLYLINKCPCALLLAFLELNSNTLSICLRELLKKVFYTKEHWSGGFFFFFPPCFYFSLP